MRRDSSPRVPQKANKLFNPEAAKARAHLRDLSMRFLDADLDGTGRLGFEEFLLLLPPSVRRTKNDDELRHWFSVADVNGDGTISKEEFFQMSLATAAKKTGSGLGHLFR